MSDARARRRDGWPAAGLLAVVGLLALPTAVAPGSRTADLTYLAGLTLVVVAVWAGALRSRGAGRRPWLVVAAAASCWLAGDVLQRILEAAGAPEVGVGPPDLLWLGSYPLLATAVVLVVRARGLPPAVAREVRLDVVVVTVGAAVTAYHLVVRPNLTAASSTLTLVVGTLYPLGDVLVFGLGLTLLMAPGRRGPATRLFVGCLGLTLPLDLLLAVLPTLAPHVDTARFDGALLVVNGMLGAAALHPDRDDLTAPVRVGPAHGMRRWRIVLLGTSLCGVTIAGALPGDGAADAVPTVAAAAVVSLTVVVRFYRAVRDQEVAEAALAHQAHHDQLTGAANRALLVDRLAGAVDACEAVVVLVDLDGFKAVNDTHGHPAGDEVLRRVTERLRALVRTTDTVARVGGDEFVLLCHGVAEQDAEALGRRVVDAVREPVDLGGALVSVGASVGVLPVRAHVADDGPDALRVRPRRSLDGPGAGGDRPDDALRGADDLLRRVDTAMYEAKRTGGGVRAAATSGAAGAPAPDAG